MNTLKKLVIKPTLKCFHHCAYCHSRQKFYNDEIRKRSFNGHMPLSIAVDVINDAYCLGMRECLISGGDPLIYPYLIDIIKEASKYKDVFVFMNSVGFDITKDIAIEILKSGLCAWNFSLDSLYCEINNKLRGVSKSVENITRSVRILNEIKSEHPEYYAFHINFMCVITRYNYKHIPSILDYALHNNISSIYFMYVYGDDKQNEFLLNSTEIHEFKTILSSEALNIFFKYPLPEIVRSNAESVLNNFFCADNSFENYSRGIYWNSFKDIKEKCNVPYHYALIEPDGSVLPCCLVEIFHKGIVGNVSEHSLETIWNSEKYNEFRSERIPHCIKCPSLRNQTLGLIPEMCRQFGL